jgi:hypothetical protein
MATAARDEKVFDDSSSTPYISTSAAGDLQLPERVRSKRDYLFSSIPAALRWRLRVDDVALYSITEARSAADMTACVFEALAGAWGGGAGGAARARAAAVTDACACVGGNVLSFATTFARVNAVEFSPQRARMLAVNAAVSGAAVELGAGLVGDAGLAGEVAAAAGAAAAAAVAGAGGAAPQPPRGRVRVAAGDYTDMWRSFEQDAVFFDPPWGGPEYLAAPKLDLYLGAVDVGALAAELLSCGAAVVVAIKAPLNYNVEGLRARLLAAGASLRPPLMRPKMQLIVAVGDPRRAQAARVSGGGGGGGEGDASLPASQQKRARVEAPTGAATAGSGTWAPTAREAAAVAPADGFALALELLLPSPLPPPPPCAGLAAAAAAAAAEAEAPGAGEWVCRALPAETRALLRALGGASPPPPLGSTGLFLRALGSGEVVAAASPEALLIAPAGAGGSDGAVTVALRTCLSGILRASEDRRRLTARSTKSAPAAERGEVFSLLPLPWERGGVGGVLLRTAHGTLVCVEGGGGGPLRLVQGPPPPGCGDCGGEGFVAAALAAAAGAGGAAAAVPRPAVFRAMFRDPLEAVLKLGGAALRAPAASLARALGAPLLDAPPADAPAPAPLGGVRGHVVPVSFRGAPAVLKSQRWDERVACELRAYAAVACALPAAAWGGGPLALPAAVARDSAACHAVFAHRGVSCAALCGAAGGALPLPAALSAAAGALAGAALLHGAGFLHADVHWGNVLLAPGAGPPPPAPALVDLGSAMPLRGGSGSGEREHAPAYTGPPRGGRWDCMPPEQFGGGRHAREGRVEMGPRADVFACGALLATLLAGAPPFAPPAGAKLTAEGAASHAGRAGGAADAAAAGAPEGLRAWLRRAMAPRQEDRFDNAAEALRELLTAAREAGV